jgi:2-polyprenyl-3-methyl-5-hydroxy-6-metoxy-1,4-benzoquinol methylase
MVGLKWGPDLRQRSQALELLDAPNIPRADLWRNLAELDTINRWLGGHAITLAGLQRLLVNLPSESEAPRKLRVVDIGCGGGDTLKAIAAWSKVAKVVQQLGLQLELTGVDLKPECLEFAQQACQGLDIHWICSDYRLLESEYDIVLTSLFCHHLDPVQLREFLLWAKQNAKMGLLINDLHRHPLAWWGIRILTALLSRSHLVKNDAPLSVWRGFSRAELAEVLAETGWKADLEWCWAFRYRVLGYV